MTQLGDAEAVKARKLARRMKFQGMDVSIETDKGQLRHWYDPHTKREGTTKMKYPYGYVRMTEGADDEHIDVFVGPNHDSDKVFVIYQMKSPEFQEYDEDKVMLGFETPKEAKAAYLEHYTSPKFFGGMSEATIDEWQEANINKSLVSEWTTLHKSFLTSSDSELQKGLMDKLKKLWRKIQEKFGRPKQVLKPKKKWIRNTEEKCKTGVCVRLDGQEIDIDDTFIAMNGMQVDGPPAHLHCKCTLEFSMSKALEYTPQQPMIPAAPMNYAPPPEDVETFEGVCNLLGRVGSMKDEELISLSEEIWGNGFQYENVSPEQARSEIMGFLLDQKDLLGVEQEMGNPPEFQPSPSLPSFNPQGSSEYSHPSRSG